MIDYNEYTENIDYVEYVIRKNEEYSLELYDPRDIQYIANKYVDAIRNRKGFDEDTVYESDKTLLAVVRRNANRLAFAHRNDDKLTEEEIYFKNFYEKLNNSYGGHGFNDSYDDRGLDEYTL